LQIGCKAHAFGEIELSLTQIRAIEYWLAQTVPDLISAEIKRADGPRQPRGS